MLGRRQLLSLNISSCNHKKEEIQTYLSLLHNTGRERERRKEKKKEENYWNYCQIVLKWFVTVVSRV